MSFINRHEIGRNISRNSKVGKPLTYGRKGKSRCKSGITSRTRVAKGSASLIITMAATHGLETRYHKDDIADVTKRMKAEHAYTFVPNDDEMKQGEKPIVYFRYKLGKESGIQAIPRLLELSRKLQLTMKIAYTSNGRISWQGSGSGKEKHVSGSIVRELFKQWENEYKWETLLVSMYGSREFVCPVKRETMEQWYLRTYTATIPHDWQGRVSFRNRISLEYNNYYDIVNVHARYCQDMVFNANTALVQRKDDIGKQFARIEREEWTRRLTLVQAWIAKGIRKDEITKTRTLLRETAKSLFARMDILKKRMPKDMAYVRTKAPIVADRVYSRKVYTIVRNYLDMPKKELFGQSDYAEQMNTIATLTSDIVCHSWTCPVSAKELSEHTPSDAIFASKHFDTEHTVHGLVPDDIGKSINPIGYNKSIPEWEAKQTIVAIGYNRICPFPIMDSYAMGI